jgi:23S rRNA (uracil1939-C5)-methyltransferase
VLLLQHDVIFINAAAAAYTHTHTNTSSNGLHSKMSHAPALSPLEESTTRIRVVQSVEEESSSSLPDYLVQTSHAKLQETAESLRQALDWNDNDNSNINSSVPTLPRLRPCQSLQEAQGYRCRCSFQVLYLNDQDIFRLAIRQNGQPVLIDTFPVANDRIQTSMKDFIEYLNQHYTQQKNPTPNNNHQHDFTNGLTSVTFVTSWNPSLCCWVTLHYEVPLSEHWRLWAQQMGTTLHWQQVTGRSKGQIQRAFPIIVNDGNDDDNDDHHMMLPDCIFLQRQGQGWNVDLDKDNLVLNEVVGQDDHDESSSIGPIISVQYVKPESAFAHPNPRVMCEALAWILNRIEGMMKESSKKQQRRQLVELYCGCGAHTMALLCSGLLAWNKKGEEDDDNPATAMFTPKMIAVELDERLIHACQQNARLNHVANQIQIVSQDAGKWATTTTTTTTSSSSSSVLVPGTILVVDPPRQGLEETVCRMAINNPNIQDILYISCGREALIRDLQILKETFEVVDCLLLDLFPQTYSVESLVHLQRKSTKK